VSAKGAGNKDSRCNKLLQNAAWKMVVMIFFGMIIISPPVYAYDIFNTQKDVPGTTASPLLEGKAYEFQTLGQPLSLQEAVERALCKNPKTRRTWADIKVQAANVGTGRAAYLPTLSGSLQGVHDASKTDVKGWPSLSSSERGTSNTESVSLSWVLYDFGGRSAALDNAKGLLAAAQANHDATLQEIFAAVSKDYHTAQAAQGTLSTTRENEQIASDILRAATKRVDKGVAPISDELQAQTVYFQAMVSLTKAEGDFKSALGALASDMGLRPDEPITLPSVEDGIKPDEEFNQSISKLIDEAVDKHPSVLAAKAQLKAAEDKVAQTRAEGLPSIKLIAQSSRNNQPASLGLGQPSFAATSRDNSVGAQISIPIFEGFSRTYRIREAEAQSELQSDALAEAEQQVGLDVWKSYQTLQSATQNLVNSSKLLDTAQQSYNAILHRYEAGVGNIIELLNGQSSMDNAKRQRVQALADWRTSRLQLGAKLGRLGMWSIDSE
jgi:outer membrane protein